MTTPSSDLQDINQTSPFIELYTIDLTAIGGSVYNYTNNVNSTGGNIVFGSTTYAALPIKTEGWDYVSTGQSPKPTLTLSNVNKTMMSAVIALGDMVGGKVTRYRTYEKFLGDSSKFIGPDVYLIEQKIAHNKNFISWQLTSVLDRMGIRLPRRQCLKDKGFPGISRTRIK